MARVCDLCGGFDDGPRHVVAHEGGGAAPVSRDLLRKVTSTKGVSDDDLAAALDSLYDQTIEVRHLDCCASAGCPDGSCVAIHAAASGTDVAPGQELTSSDGVTRDQDLLDFILSGAVDTVGSDLTQGA